jgi:PPM family protein phosphatase
MEYFGATHKGRVRQDNEDCFHTGDNLFIVADGMGGHKAGEVASRLSVEYFLKYFEEKTGGKKHISTKSVRRLLTDSVGYANSIVFKESVSNLDYSGMGTTLTACYAEPVTAHIIHVGDSRAYLIRDNAISLITSDHTFAGELYRRGEITYEDSFDHPRRNYLTNVLGMADRIIPEYHQLKVRESDRLILCSDGLNAMLRDELILKISDRSNGPEKSAKGLIRQANKLGGKDNISVIVIDFYG